MRTLHRARPCLFRSGSRKVLANVYRLSKVSLLRKKIAALTHPLPFEKFLMAKAWNGYSKHTAQRSVLFRSNAVAMFVARSFITFAVEPEKQHESKRKFIGKTLYQ